MTIKAVYLESIICRRCEGEGACSLVTRAQEHFFQCPDCQGKGAVWREIKKENKNMSSKVLEAKNIVVETVGPYGIKAEGKWFNLNDNMKDFKFEKGKTYHISFSPTAKGKNYIYSAEAVEKQQSQAVEQKADAHNVVKAQDDYLKKLDDKSEQIKRQGLIQAALQSPALPAFAEDPESYWNLVVDFANRGVAYVEKRIV